MGIRDPPDPEAGRSSVVRGNSDANATENQINIFFMLSLVSLETV
jgi:hypothetical protein